MITVSNEHGKFVFSRDSAGAGYWCCVSGVVPGLFGKSSGLAVPLFYSVELTKQAIASGIKSEQVAKYLSKKKVKASENKKERKAKKTRLISVFNPFVL